MVALISAMDRDPRWCTAIPYGCVVRRVRRLLSPSTCTCRQVMPNAGRSIAHATMPAVVRCTSCGRANMRRTIVRVRHRLLLRVAPRHRRHPRRDRHMRRAPMTARLRRHLKVDMTAGMIVETTAGMTAKMTAKTTVVMIVGVVTERIVT